MLRPYDSTEFVAARDRLCLSQALRPIVETHFPALGWDRFRDLLSRLPDVNAYQDKVISPLIDSLIRKTSGGLTISGLENLQSGQTYLFISNHRDIVCDPAIFTNELHKAGLRTPQICLGDNLLARPLVADLVKMNKGVTVRRGLAARELLAASLELSGYIRDTVESGTDHVWIAQREGRAKDGDDRTASGVLRMLALTGDGAPIARLARLRPVPVAISYELDPCDALKARELHLASTPDGYVKAPGEDEASMLLGITGQKGRIHIAVGKPLGPVFEQIEKAGGDRRAQLDAAMEEIDRRIHYAYKLWPSNFAAYDLLEGGTVMRDFYDEASGRRFQERLEKVEPAVREHFLLSYATPVRNRLRLKTQRVETKLHEISL